MLVLEKYNYMILFINFFVVKSRMGKNVLKHHTEKQPCCKLQHSFPFQYPIEGRPVDAENLGCLLLVPLNLLKHLKNILPFHLF